ncbi:hypothetical protein B0T25DRAFT_164933 [Lasiosphaeria hispida]|uniref:Secreted protein n=1 Tax=Lasiosphaeria hispida TaxID=260671 RepID=A0AAJ0HMH8_9PEZI|nr:hypothetical protein B0T25DRAFT_164933 [Lasiosphaeria hispida]
MFFISGCGVGAMVWQALTAATKLVALFAVLCPSAAPMSHARHRHGPGRASSFPTHVRNWCCQEGVPLHSYYRWPGHTLEPPPLKIREPLARSQISHLSVCKCMCCRTAAEKPPTCLAKIKYRHQTISQPRPPQPKKLEPLIFAPNPEQNPSSSGERHPRQVSPSPTQAISFPFWCRASRPSSPARLPIRAPTLDACKASHQQEGLRSLALVCRVQVAATRLFRRRIDRGFSCRAGCSNTNTHPHSRGK